MYTLNRFLISMKTINSYLLLGVVFLGILSAQGQEPGYRRVFRLNPSKNQNFAVSGQLLWHSRYVSEGVNNLPGSSLLASELQLSIRDFGAGVWWGKGLQERYNELNFFAFYEFELRPIEFVLGVEISTQPSPGGPATAELFAEMAHQPIPAINLFLIALYDFIEEQGGYIETGAEIPLSFAEVRLNITPYSLISLDLGYMSEPRTPALNHFQFGAIAELLITDNILFLTNLNQSIALTNLRDEGLGDQWWIETGVGFEF
ncbi:hypothetical protein QA601_15450 [Chitinispirillales bacterium ANBcel5]|uniref:hypothetical protein n=1 Tax=Cellulosispirillum alkaliphilum TaxID=3039283 RepID=UPI002A5794C7|nr:hypothetical protein [Chitinispirillales bacterium ANBcel5]